MGECKGQALIEKIDISFDGGQTWFPTNVDSKSNTWSFDLSSPIGNGETYQVITRAVDRSSRVERTVNPNLDVRFRKRPITVFIVAPGTGRE